MKHIYRNKQFTAEFTDEDGYFSLTGDVNGGSGACGDSIVKIDPRFKLMNSMHLCNAKTGAPMHAEANATYWAESAMVDILSKHLRIDIASAEGLAGRVFIAGQKGMAIGEESKKAELDRIGNAMRVIKVDARPDGKKTVYDIRNTLNAVNNGLRLEEKVGFVKDKKNTFFWSGEWDATKIMAVKATMIANLEKSQKAADNLPGLHAAAEKKQVMETYVNGLRDGWLQDVEDVIEQAEDLLDEYEEEYEAEHADDFDWETFDEPAKVKALSEWLECDPDDITEEDSNRFGAHGREYLVVDDDEADELWDESLDNYIDECLEIPDSMKNYFDRDKFKDDAKVDGRGHSLGRYDGNEYDVEVEHDGVKETYYIYRQ